MGYTHECSKHAVSTEHKTGPQPRGHAAPGGAATLPLRVKQTYDTPEEPLQGFPGGSVVKNLPANAGDTATIPGPGRSHMPQSN